MLLPALDVSRITSARMEYKQNKRRLYIKDENSPSSRNDQTPLMRLMLHPLFDRNLMSIVFGYFCDDIENDKSCVIKSRF